MGPSAKAILQLLMLVSAITAVFSWVLPQHPDATVWAVRLSTALAAPAIFWFLCRVDHRREVLDDHLAGVSSRYFERDGLCFAFVPAIVDGRCWMSVYFQNRYERPCVGRIVLKPPAKNLWIGRWPLTTIDVEVACDGAAFGVHRTPWPVPAKLQGRVAKCEVAAAATYRGGRGKLMRYREGLRAGTPGSDLGRAAATLGMAAVGGLYLSHPAIVRIRLPTDVAEEAFATDAATTEIIWRPDLPTGGFPVVMAPPA